MIYYQILLEQPVIELVATERTSTEGIGLIIQILNSWVDDALE